jgi:hypothetical protein
MGIGASNDEAAHTPDSVGAEMAGAEAPSFQPRP